MKKTTIAILAAVALVAACASAPDHGLFVVARDAQGYPTAWIMGVSQAEANKRYLDSQMKAQADAWKPMAPAAKK